MGLNLNLALPYLTPSHSADDTAPLFAYGSTDSPITRVFSTTLVINYMIDEPGALVFVRERDVEHGRRDALHARALDNLRAHTARRKLRYEARGATHVAKLDGQHDASLLLLDELWDPPTRIADPQGELLAAVPARHLLVFTGSDAQHGPLELRAIVNEATSKERALSPEIFVRRNRRWEPWDQTFF